MLNASCNLPLNTDTLGLTYIYSVIFMPWHANREGGGSGWRGGLDPDLLVLPVRAAALGVWPREAAVLGAIPRQPKICQFQDSHDGPRVSAAVLHTRVSFSSCFVTGFCSLGCPFCAKHVTDTKIGRIRQKFYFIFLQCQYCNASRCYNTKVKLVKFHIILNWEFKLEVSH